MERGLWTREIPLEETPSTEFVARKNSTESSTSGILRSWFRTNRGIRARPMKPGEMLDEIIVETATRQFGNGNGKPCFAKNEASRSRILKRICYYCHNEEKFK